jgi:hypothetical protein
VTQQIISMPPTVYFESVDSMKLQRGGAQLRSRYTGARQYQKFYYALWNLTGQLIPMDGTDARLWRSFLAKLEGAANALRMPVPGYTGPSTGYAGAAPTVNGSVAARATTMNITGPTSTQILKEGDYFTVNDELKMASADVTTDGTGAAVLPFQPFCRGGISSGATVNVATPTCLMVAADDAPADWKLSAPVLHTIKLNLVENV